MTRKDLDRFKTWFFDYVAPYYTGDRAYDRPVRLKQEHTMRVCREIEMLGRCLNLNPQEMILAEAMALFHDIGRFQQYAVYGTFSDRDSENHARIGLRQLARHHVLKGCAPFERRLITKAIAHHNAARLPSGEDDETALFFMRLLRDADKLDIWKVFIDYYSEREKPASSTVVHGLPDLPAISDRIIKRLGQRRIARLEDLESLNDLKLLQISWVFDLNFRPALEAVKQRRYIERIFTTLPPDPEIRAAVDQVRDYLDSILKYPSAARDCRTPMTLQCRN